MYCPRDVTQCSLADIYRHFGLFYPEDGGRTVFRRIGKHLPNYTEPLMVIFIVSAVITSGFTLEI
jgi:hypothetical protein